MEIVNLTKKAERENKPMTPEKICEFASSPVKIARNFVEATNQFHSSQDNIAYQFASQMINSTQTPDSDDQRQNLANILYKDFNKHLKRLSEPDPDTDNDQLKRGLINAAQTVLYPSQNNDLYIESLDMLKKATSKDIAIQTQ